MVYNKKTNLRYQGDESLKEVHLYIDESGNLGNGGNYFVIACIVTNNEKSLNNFMKKTERKVKKTFPSYINKKEIKASEANPIIKEYYLRKLSEKDFDLYYTVARKDCIFDYLKEDKNALYSYLLHFLIKEIIKDNPDEITIILDNRSIKTKSTNSFADYIKIKIMYEWGYNCKIIVRYVESSNSYLVQIADFFANALWSHYEYGEDFYYNLVIKRLKYAEKFPFRCF